MAQRSKSRFVWWGIRLIALTVTVVLAYRAYEADSYRGLIGLLVAVGLGALMSYSNRQGEKLAIENMKKYGLEPDRDEGLASL